MSQYAFPLTLSPVFSAANFYVSPCNSDAFRWIESWPNWPAAALLLSGPPGSGKTHLGQLWAGRAGAAVAEAAAWSLDKHKSGALLLENIEHLPREQDLFHLLNLAKETPFALLLTSQKPASALPFTLPDLVSRLKALPTAQIHPPDDEALLGAFRKQFSDRQLKVEEEALQYVLARMDRSFFAVNQLVDRLDREALAQKKTVSIPFIRQQLGY